MTLSARRYGGDDSLGGFGGVGGFGGGEPRAPAPGKRTLTSAIQRKDAPDAGGGAAPPVLRAGPSGAGADPFDFSYGKPLAENDQAVASEVKRLIATGERDAYRIADLVLRR